MNKITLLPASSYLRAGDSFTAICVDVGPFSGARILATIESINQSGRFKGATVMRKLSQSKGQKCEWIHN